MLAVARLLIGGRGRLAEAGSQGAGASAASGASVGVPARAGTAAALAANSPSAAAGSGSSVAGSAGSCPASSGSASAGASPAFGAASGASVWPAPSSGPGCGGVPMGVVREPVVRERAGPTRLLGQPGRRAAVRRGLQSGVLTVDRERAGVPGDRTVGPPPGAVGGHPLAGRRAVVGRGATGRGMQPLGAPSAANSPESPAAGPGHAGVLAVGHAQPAAGGRLRGGGRRGGRGRARVALDRVPPESSTPSSAAGTDHWPVCPCRCPGWRLAAAPVRTGRGWCSLGAGVAAGAADPPEGHPQLGGRLRVLRPVRRGRRTAAIPPA
ncbi:hypothetical protein SANTM175S_06960 [Streptomyces antimycoticus]